MAESVHPGEWLGRDVFLGSGDKLGRLEDVYYDADSDIATFLCIKAHLLSSKQVLVPASRVHASPRGLTVDWTSDDVREAPTTKPEEGLSPEQEERAFRHYGMDYAPPSTGSGRRLVRH